MSREPVSTMRQQYVQYQQAKAFGIPSLGVDVVNWGYWGKKR